MSAIVAGIKHSLGFKNPDQCGHPEQGQRVGRSLGQVIHQYAVGVIEAEAMEETSSLKTSFPVTSRSSNSRVEDPEGEVEEQVQRELQGIGDSSKTKEAITKVEDLMKGGEEEFSLPAPLRREIHRLHRNLGHPAKEVFVRALRHSGVRFEVLDWVKSHFRCPTCEARTKPSPARPGHLARALEFNVVIGIDLIFVDVFNETHIMLNCLCWGTNFQQVALCQNKGAEEVRNVFWAEWIKHYGCPQLIILDRGKEFFGSQFQEQIGSMGIALHFTDPESPWQNTRTERAGGIFKEKLKVVIQHAAATKDELPLCIAEVVSARNRFMDRFGFSPMQRVFGKTVRMPASLMSSDALDADLVQAAATDPVVRSWTIRECAAQEWLKRQDQGAVQRSLRAKTRTSDTKSIPLGSWVYVFRDNPQHHGWIGPGVLLAQDPSGNSWWVSMRGRLWKASREQIRSATPEEELGAELVAELSKDMLEKLNSPGQLAFQDVSQEAPPDTFEEEDMVRLFRITEERDRLQPQEHPDQTADQASSFPDESTEPGESMPTAMEVDESRRASLQEAPNELTAQPIVVEEEPGDVEMPSSLPENPVERPSEPVSVENENVFTDVPLVVDESSHGTLRAPRIKRAESRPAPYPFSGSAPSLPPPPGRSFYCEVINFDKSEDLAQFESDSAFIGATWKFDREQHSRVLQPHPAYTYTFDRHKAEASFSIRDNCMYVTKAKTSFGQVEFKDLHEKEKEIFRAARKKEIDSLISNGAVKVLSVEESLEFSRMFPSQVIESRFVDRYKPKEIDHSTLEHYKKKAIQEGHLDAVPLEKDHTSPKSRWCVIGWKDPDVHEVERSSPTPLSSSLYCCFQLAASRRWGARIKDVKTAFLQSLPTTRSRKLACRQPRDETLPGLDPRQLVLLLTEVYGLVSGPSWWRRSLLELITNRLGYVLNPYNKCVLTLPSKSSKPDAPTEGFIVIEVDDLAEAGSERHVEKMKELEKLLKFGKIEELYGNKDGSTYAGRHIQQMSDYSFEHHMDEYIYTRLEPVRLSRKVLKKDASQVKLDEKEKTQLRGLIASLNWTSREGRPDASAAASILASAFPEPSVSHVLSGNDVVKHLKLFPIRLKIHAIREKELRNLLIADSAFDTSGREKSQFGWLLGFTDSTLNQGQTAPVSLMQWRSKRLRRKAASSMMCESIAMSAATGALERQDAFMHSLRFSNFSPRERQRGEDARMEMLGKTSVFSKDVSAFQDPASIIVMDAKALFDNLGSEQSQGDDDRAALEVAIIKESLLMVGGRPRWIPHNENPSDALTKVDGAHVQPMLKLLQSNSFRIEEEEQVLQRGRQSENRLKVGARAAVGTSIFGGCETSNQSFPHSNSSHVHFT